MPVGERRAVGAHHHDVAGRPEVGLEVGDRAGVLACGVDVGEGQCEVAGGAYGGVALDADAHAVDGPRADIAGGHGRCGRLAAGDRDGVGVEDVAHLPVAAELGVDQVLAGGRERRLDRVHARGAGRLGVDVGEGAEVGAGDDHVHPHLVGADQVADGFAGGGVADLDGQLGGLPGVDGRRSDEVHGQAGLGRGDRRRCRLLP